ncbi:MAG: hypothetical protein IJK41_12675 [Muribaculaceae bacterium]|nr:hypothetical protein [Muribaculaceae bacterium]
MKKLLSLLLTLTLATSAFAECAFYMDDFVVNRDQIGNNTEITLPIKATFSGRLNGWELKFVYPEHLIPTYIEPGADMTVTYYNARGKEQTLDAPLSGAREPWDHLLCAIATQGFYQDPNGEDPTAWVSYGAVKWEGGVYEEMLLLSFIVEEGFEGGDIIIKTCCGSGLDPREGGSIYNNGDHKQWFERTVHASLQAITEAPEITYTMDEDEAIVTATGNGEVLLYVNGELVTNPYTIARGAEDVEYTITATAQGEGEVISEPAELKLLVPAKPEAVYGFGLRKVWSVDLPAQMPEGLVTNDMRQGFGMNGKFYVNSKKSVLDSATMTYTTVPTVYVFDQTGRVEKTYPGGLNCGITRDEAGNLVISDAQFPNNWNETATIKVINPETDVTKVYTVPTECGIAGRCDFIGFAKGDLMQDGQLYLVSNTSGTGVSIMTITDGEVNTDESYLANCDGVTPTTNTVVNYYKNLAGEDAMLYVTRNAAPVIMQFDGSDLVGQAITLPNKGACNGVFPFIYDGKEFFLYPTLPNYLDGFAIAEAGVKDPYVTNDPNYKTNPNGIQANWLNAEVDDEGVTIYQYVPGGHVAVYRLGDGERTQMPVITYETNDEAVVITATGSANVKMYVDGVLVDNPYTIARGEEDVTVTVTATAQKDGKIISETAEEQILIPALPAKTAMPVITFNTTDEAVEITATGDGEVLLYVNGELVDNPYTIARGEEDVTISIVATAQEEGKRISDPAELELVIPKYIPQTEMPVITFNTTDDAVIITAEGEGEVLLYVNGELVENPYTIMRGEEDVTVTVTATAQGEGKRISDVATQELVIPALPAKTEMPVITFETLDDAVVITATGEGEVLLYVNGELVENPYTIARGEEDVTVTIVATAQEEGKRISDAAEMTLVIPAYQVTATPTISVEVTDDYVIITATGDGDVQLYVNGEPVENPYTITRGEEDVDIEVYATAKEDGKLMSTTEVQVVTIPKHSGIDEILNNKTVANVRYFNMAGQEMTEVNGATIIITTYTDGTHSTVKVIK